MAILKAEGASLQFDETKVVPEDKFIIDKLWTLVSTHGIDFDSVSTGVMPSPDCGYFDLAHRFWHSSLCIYFAGMCKCFGAGGVGFVEPWLFNVRHSFELYIKGFLMCLVWYDELKENLLETGRKEQTKLISNLHNLEELYKKYEHSLQKTINLWDVQQLGEKPDINLLKLSSQSAEALNELSQMDSTGFKFRYPTLRSPGQDKPCSHHIQPLSWEWNEGKLFPITGLPKSSGVFFQHIKSMNAIYGLMAELINIAQYHDAIYDYISETQYVAREIYCEFAFDY